MANDAVFSIIENIPGGIQVDLQDTDLPYGRPREMTAYETGGKIDIAGDGLYNPGSNKVVLQIMTTNKQRPFVIKGAFRDRIFAGAQLGELSNHARFQRDRLELIRSNGNPLKLRGLSEERDAILWETKFSEQGAHDIEYELTFFISVPAVGQNTFENIANSGQQDLFDIESEMAVKVAELQTEYAALVIQATANAIFANMFTAISSSLDQLATYTQVLGNVTGSIPQRIVNEINHVVAAAKSVQDNAENAKNTIDSLATSDVMVFSDATSTASWWMVSYDSHQAFDLIINQMRQIKFQALQKIRSFTRLYRVKPDDTLESIAFTQLGSKSRIMDLNLRTDQLQPGKYVRIPKQ